MNGLLHANILFLRGRHKEAFDAFVKVARDYHDPVAANDLGYMYYRGIGVERDYEKAKAYFLTGGYGDGGVGFYNLALIYLRGHGVESDFEKAIEYMKRSAEMGCADAQLYLGLAYILGCAFDPFEVECLSLIPFYTVIYKDRSAPLLEGDGYDPGLEDRRYEVIEADGDEAVRMYRNLVSKHGDDPYAERQCGAAEFMIAKAQIEGLGNSYNPKLGYNRMYKAAIYNESAEAARYLLENAETAKGYSVNVEKIANLLQYGYFRPSIGNLGTMREHRIPPLLPKVN